MEKSDVTSTTQNQKWLIISGVSLSLLLLLFLPFSYFSLAPIVGVFLVIFQTTRIHGIFLLITAAFYWVLAMMAATMGGLPSSDINFNFVWGWAIFLVYYLKPFFTLAITFNLLFLCPIILMEFGYLIYQHKHWKTIITMSVLLVMFCSFGYQYAKASAEKFEALEPLQGQVITQDRLFEISGKPAYYRGNKEYGYYIKGERMIAVHFMNDGTCKIIDGQGWFLD